MIDNSDRIAGYFHPSHRSKVPGPTASYGLTESGYDVRTAYAVEFYWVLGLFRAHRVWQNGLLVRKGWGHNVLVSTAEHIRMPATHCVRTGNKSTWARKFLDASLCTDLEPGWEGWLTVELSYRGGKPLTVSQGDGILNLKFCELLVPRVYIGKYQHQPNHPVESIPDRP